MNNDEIKNQITKFKARRLKAKLSYYCATTSLFLALSTLSSGVTQTSLTSLALVLPLPIYFVLQSLKFAKKSKSIKTRLNLLRLQDQRDNPRFSLINFLSQPSLAFRLSLTLLILIIFTSVARSRTVDPTISMSPTSSINSH